MVDETRRTVLIGEGMPTDAILIFQERNGGLRVGIGSIECKYPIFTVFKPTTTEKFRVDILLQKKRSGLAIRFRFQQV